MRSWPPPARCGCGEPLRELPRDVPGRARDGRLPGRPRARPPARDPRGRPSPAARQPVEHGRRASTWAWPPGARRAPGWTSSTGGTCRRPPARVTESDFVPLSQLYARHATVSAGDETFATRTWSEVDVVQWTARQPEARAWYRVPNERLSERVRDRTVADMVAAAEAAGAPVERERRRRSRWACAPGSRRPWAGSRSIRAAASPTASRRGRGRRRRDGRRILVRPGRGARPRNGRRRGGARVKEMPTSDFTRRRRGGAPPRRPRDASAHAGRGRRSRPPRPAGRPRRARGLRRAGRAAHAAVRGRGRGARRARRRTAPRRRPPARR